MKRIIAFLFLISVIACNKDNEPDCVKWNVLYWQGTAARVTVTSNYAPYRGEKEICGAGKDTVSRGKIVVLSQVNSNLYNYLSFESKK